MKLIQKSLFLILTVILSGNIYAGSASGKLSALADSLIKGYAAKAVVSKTSLAVFPLNCDEKLEKQRVGFAASEVMSHRFVADGAFTVVERGEIGKLLSEQKLQASGAVDSDTAVRLGKVLGAGVILLGNIQKVDGKYQVNARLVNAETSEVLVSGYTELDANAFEADARVYLNLVPEEQALGIYFLSNIRQNTNDISAQSYNDPATGWTQLKPGPFTLSFIGVGIRYFVKKRIVVDFAYMGTPAGEKAGTEGSGVYKINAKSFRGLFSLKTKVSRTFAYYLGAGATSYIITIEGVKPSYLTPTIQARIEVFPQSRIGFSMMAGYDFKDKAITQKKWGNPPTIVRVAKVGKLYIEPSLSIYF